MKLNIKNKFFMYLACFVVVMGCGLVIAISSMESRMNNSASVNLAGRLGIYSQQISKDAFILTLGTEEARERLAKNSEEFDKNLSVLSKGGAIETENGRIEITPVDKPEVVEQIRKIEAVWDEFYKNIKILVDKESDLPTFTAAAKKLEADNMALLKELEHSANMYAEIEVANMRHFFMVTLAIILAITLAMSIIGFYIIKLIIVNPIARVVDTAQALSEGNLNVSDLDIRSRDEMHVLGSALNRMKNYLHNMMERVKVMSEDIASISTDLSILSGQIVQGAEKQSSQTEQVAVSMKEMNSAVIEVTRNSQTAADSSGAAHERAVKGGEVINNAVQGMLEVAETVTACSNQVAALGTSSDKIGEIVSVINDIADQTNLLALNAAIEAARAGEHGRGFAVVADEVRKLAEKTSKATKEIAGMIKTIQADTQEAILSMERGTKQTRDNVEYANGAGDALKEIVSGVQKTSELIRQNATAVEEQSSTADEITNRVNEIAEIARKTSNDIKSITEASGNLNKMAGELKGLVGAFNLQTAGPGTPRLKVVEGRAMPGFASKIAVS